jgi:5-methyltetrahydropteroyltriglutamate--homocysteine methyltransferase
MLIPTESIGSIPRPRELIDALKEHQIGKLTQERLNLLYNDALQNTIQLFEATGSPVISDGEQLKSSFVTYPLSGLTNITKDGILITFEDGHTRQLPKLSSGPFRYSHYAGDYIKASKRYTTKPLKQAVISASALSLIYPEEGILGYSHETFINDLVAETIADIRSCFAEGAHHVQIDFTEGRLSLKLDPSQELLKHFISLNNRVLEAFTKEDQNRIGIHTCPGGDNDSTHSADIDYKYLIPSLFQLNAGNFYIQLASEKNPEDVLNTIKQHLNPGQTIYIGVIDVCNPEVEEPETVRDRVLCAAEYIPINQLGTTDDCGFSPFQDDISTSREIAFAKIKSRVVGTKMAEKYFRKFTI